MADYDDLADQMVRGDALTLTNNMADASGQNPDQVAQHDRMARQLGVPIQSVQSDPDFARQQVVAQGFDASKVVTQYPHLAQFLQSPVNTAKAQDDLPTLAATEAAVKMLPKPAQPDIEGHAIGDDLEGAPYALAQGLGGAYNEAGKAFGLAVGAFPTMYDRLASAITGRDQTGAGDWYWQHFVAPLDEKASVFNLSPNAGLLQKVTHGVGGLLGTLSQIAMGGEAAPAAEAPSALSAVGSATASAVKSMAFPSITQAINTGSDVFSQTGSGVAAVKAAATAYGTTSAMGILPMSLEGPLAMRVASGLPLGVMTGELNRQTMNLALPTTMQQPAPTASDTIVNGLTGAILAGAMGAEPAPHERALVQAFQDAKKADDAVQAGATLQGLSELAGQSKLRERDPEAFKEFVQKVADDGHLSEVWVNARAFTDALAQSGLQGEEVQAKLPDVARQLPEALGAGGDVRIPIADYATHIAGTPLDQALLQHMKTDPDGMTFKEGQDALAQQQADMAARAKDVTAEQQAKDERDQQLDAIRSDVAGQLDATGRFTPDISRAYADLHRSWYDAMSERMGLSPAELRQRMPLSIEAGLAGAPDSLSQGAPHATITGEEFGPAGTDVAALRSAAKGWYDQNLRGTSVVNDASGREVKFAGSRKAFNSSADPDKVRLFAALPDLVKNGEIVRSEPARGTEQNVKAFHRLEGVVDVGGEPTRVGVTIREDNHGNLYYNHNPVKEEAPKSSELADTAHKAEGGTGNKEALEQTVHPAAGDINLQVLGQGEKARAFYSPSARRMVLLKDADLSSFLHESGHFFLEGLHDLAQHPEAPQGIKDDFDTLLKSFGVAGDTPEARMADWTARDLEGKRVGHEQFAEGFEQYLMDGKAPVPELQSLFGRFRSWLMRLYQGVRGSVSDDVRGVMDRMFASEQAINEAERARSYMAPDLSAEHGELIDQYKSLGKEATEQAIADMQARSLRDMKWLSNAKSKAMRDLQRQAKDARDAVTAEVTQEVESLPAFKAAADLRQAKGSTDIERDLIAEKHGYQGQQDMLQDIADHGSKAEAIAGLVDQRMLERHGELTDPKSIERAAEAAIHNEARAKMMATGLKMFTKSPMSATEIAKAAKAAADTAIAAKKVGELRPNQYSAAETRANKELLKLAPRDPAGAANAQRAALLNNRLFKSATEAVDDVQRGLAHIKRLQSAAVLKKVAGEERDQILSLLAKYDFRKNPDDAPTRREINLRQWVDAQIKAGNMPYVDDEALQARPRTQYRDLPVETFRALVDTLRSIEHAGREATKLDIEGRRVDLRDYIDNELVPAMDKRGDRYPVGDVLDHPANRGKPELQSHLDAATSWMNRAHEMALDPVHRMEIVDNHQVLGPFARSIFNPMFEAGTREARMGDAVNKAAIENARALGREWQEGRQDLVPNRTLIDAQASRQEGRRVFLRITRDNLVGMLVHAGNESNFDRLCRGREWDPAEVQRFINENITAKDLDAANRIWRMASMHWEEQVAQARRLSAIVPEKIEARAFDTPVGRAEGGYAPLRYDPLRSRVGARAEQAAEVNPNDSLRSAGNYLNRQSTVAGSMHSRLENYVDVVDLRLSRIQEAIHEDIHDLAFRETILNTNKILNDGNFRAGFMRAYGRNEYQAVTGWVRRFVNIAQKDPNVDAFDAAMRYTRTGIVANAIGFRASVVEKHGLSAALKSAGYFLGGGEKFFGRRLALMATDYTNQVETAKAKFGEIFTRSLQFDRDYREGMRSMLEPESILSKSHRYGHWLVAKADQFTAVPTAWAAYDRAVTEGIPVSQGGTGTPMSDADAVAYANNVVRSAHGGSTDVTRSNLMTTNSETVKMFTMMYGFMNNSYGQAVSIIDRLQQQGYKVAPESLAQAFLVFGGSSIAAALVRYGAPDKEHLAEWLAEAGLSETVAMIPGGASFMQLVQAARGAGETPAAQWESTVLQPVKDAAKAVQGKAPGKPIQDLGNAIGVLGHVSGAGQLGTSLQYLEDVHTGKEQPQTALDVAQGMTVGAKHKKP